MTNREELAGRLDEHARRYERSALMAENRAKRRTDSFRAANERGQAKLFRSRAADMKQAAAALRQPVPGVTVEEVARVIVDGTGVGTLGMTHEASMAAAREIAQAIAALYGRGG